MINSTCMRYDSDIGGNIHMQCLACFLLWQPSWPKPIFKYLFGLWVTVQCQGRRGRRRKLKWRPCADHVGMFLTSTLLQSVFLRYPGPPPHRWHCPRQTELSNQSSIRKMPDRHDLIPGQSDVGHFSIKVPFSQDTIISILFILHHVS